MQSIVYCTPGEPCDVRASVCVCVLPHSCVCVCVFLHLCRVFACGDLHVCIFKEKSLPDGFVCLLDEGKREGGGRERSRRESLSLRVCWQAYVCVRTIGLFVYTSGCVYVCVCQWRHTLHGCLRAHNCAFASVTVHTVYEHACPSCLFL